MPSLYYSDAVCSKPLFEQVKEKIIDQIRKGVWQANAMLPNELALADMYSVSQGTVRRALQALVQEGILVRHQGRGTFVASFRRNVSNVKTRINWFESDDVTLKVGQSKIVSFEKIAPLGKVLQRVGTQQGERVFHIRRETSWAPNGEVVCFDDIYLPERFYPGLTLEKLTSSDYPIIYAFYQEVYGVTVTHMQDVARAVLLNPEQAQKAGVQTPFPGIMIQRTFHNSYGEIVELRFLLNVTENQSMILSR